MDQTRRGGIALDLLAEPEDVDVDGAVRDGAVLAPDGVQQLLAAEDHAGAGHEEFEQAELGGGERERLAFQLDLATAAVQLDVAGLEYTGRRGLRAELQLDAGDH